MRFLQVGLGYRSQAFKQVISEMDDLTCAGVVLRRNLSATVPVYTDLPTAIAEVKPDFVLSFTPPHTTPTVLRTCVEAGVHVLAETPPAKTVEDLDSLADIADSPLAQVAEQYSLMPLHAACLDVVRRGLIGEVTQVQISSTQTYHAMALVRAYLGVESGPAQVRAAQFSGPLMNPLTRAGWTGETEPGEAACTIGTVDFGEGKSGLYDFTDNQTRNLLRTRRLVVRGSHGEISGDTVVRLAGPALITTTHMHRRQTGHDLDLNGYSSTEITLGDEVLWSNPFPDKRWNDDEIAVATLIRQMVAYVGGRLGASTPDAPAPYPLSQAMYDARLGLALAESVETDAPVSVG
ncbi:MAG: Gfo/Idh/MocA family oxidoreductase [Propionibacteriaceae bacterium]|jgi:predicted dehydrogenase|nr:Gfo/Idh/MocA family oxidoreductase [Propionibacteriaceae bacterium]